MGFKWYFDPIVVMLVDPVVVIFFEMHLIQHFFFKFSFQKKIQVWDLIGALIPYL